jgi:hypothetical protein
VAAHSFIRPKPPAGSLRVRRLCLRGMKKTQLQVTDGHGFSLATGD